MKSEEYARHDALGLAELVRRRETTPLELVDAAIARIETVNPKLNAVVHLMFEKARATAKSELPDGPFRGVPFLVKDLDGYLAGEPFTGSSRSLLGFVPTHDSSLFVRMKRTGVVIAGKTNTPELGILGTTESELRGPARNPWNVACSTGGSSGGSAAAVAARCVPMAHAGDGGGSIRIPASACGVFGLKPTRARTPVGPDVGEGWGGLVSSHVVSRSVRDSAAMLDAVHGYEPGAPYDAPPFSGSFLDESRRAPSKLRVAFHTGSLLGQATHPDCVEAVNDAARLCASLGHDVEEAVPRIDREALVEAYFVLVAVGVARTIGETESRTGKPPRASDFEPSTWFLGQAGNALRAHELESARAVVHRAGYELARFHARYDVFLSSTIPYPPMRLGTVDLKTWEKVGLAALRRVPTGRAHVKTLMSLAAPLLEHWANTMLFNQTGQPAMSVPLFWNGEGLPIGAQFAARFGDEATLFRLAAQLESARPWGSRAPSI